MHNHINTHTLHPNLSHKPLLYHVDHGQGANKQDPHASLLTSTQNDTHVLPKSCTPKDLNQALLPYLYYTTSTSLNPSLDPVNTNAMKRKGIDHDMSFRSCSHGVKVREDGTNMGLVSSIQEEKKRENSYKVEEDGTNMGLDPSTQKEQRGANSYKSKLLPHKIYAINIKEIDEERSITSCSYGDMKVKEEDTNMGLNSSNTQEGRRRGICYDKKEDVLSSQYCKAGNFDASTPTKLDANNNDGDILHYSPLSIPKSEVISRASICKASKCPRKRKAHQKQIICVPLTSGNKSPGECLHSDAWAWRKYGQKPIKGSPYPRRKGYGYRLCLVAQRMPIIMLGCCIWGYYRCSSCKGCTARKQVERSRSDPSMLVITYTSEHNHTWQANKKNPQNLEATSNENPHSVHPHEKPNSLNSSMKHSDNIHIKTLSIDSPCITTLEGDSPHIPSINDIENLHDERPQNELDYFGLLEELHGNSSLMVFESAKSPLPDHEDPIAIVHSNVVDPFNLFNWSSNIGINYYSAT